MLYVTISATMPTFASSQEDAIASIPCCLVQLIDLLMDTCEGTPCRTSHTQR